MKTLSKQTRCSPVSASSTPVLLRRTEYTRGFTVLPETHKYLHGEKVAFGIVCQMVLENTPAEIVDKVMRFMVAIGLPVTLADLGVDTVQEKVMAIAEKTAGGPLIHQEPFIVTKERVYGAIIAADTLGRKYKNL